MNVVKNSSYGMSLLLFDIDENILIFYLTNFLLNILTITLSSMDFITTNKNKQHTKRVSNRSCAAYLKRLMTRNVPNCLEDKTMHLHNIPVLKCHKLSELTILYLFILGSPIYHIKIKTRHSFSHGLSNNFPLPNDLLHHSHLAYRYANSLSLKIQYP